MVRSDNTSAATHELRSSRGRALNDNYGALLDHYGLRSTRINPGQSHENGVAEHAHYRLKDAIDQALILRGSRDFDTVDDYASFVRQMVERRNRLVQGKLEQELPCLGPLPPAPVPEYANYQSKVRKWCTIQVAGHSYSVPSRLIGKEVQIRLYADWVEVYYKGHRVERMERVRGEGEANVNYRHVIGSLVRKPGAFARYRFREQLFPTLHFRLTYDALRQWRGERADVEYVRILHLAATTMEATVDSALSLLLEAGESFDYAEVRDSGRAQGARSSGAGLVWEAGPENLRPPAHGQPGCGGGVRMTDTSVMQDRIGQLCGQFKLPTMGAQSVARFTAAGHGGALATFLEVLEQEAEDRRHRRINRLRRGVPAALGQDLGNLRARPSPLALRQQLDQLAQGSFVERGINVLAFGLPGTGKTHALCALGHRLVEAGHSVLFAPAYRLVQELLAAKRDLDLPASCASWTTSTSCSWTTWATCPRAPRNRRSSSPSSPNATSAGRWASRALPQQNRYPTRLVASNKMLPKIGEAIAWEEASARWQNRNCWRRSEDRYRASSKKDKGRILDEFIAVTGHHRKHGIRLLGQSATTESSSRRQKGPTQLRRVGSPGGDRGLGSR